MNSQSCKSQPRTQSANFMTVLLLMTLLCALVTFSQPKRSPFEHLTLPSMNSETMNAISSCSIASVFAKETTGEMSVYPIPVNVSGFELSVGPDSVIESVCESV